MRAARVDANHADVVRALRQIGASVQSLATIGQGCPDLLVGWRGQNLLYEIKDGRKPASRRVLTVDEWSWHQNWRGRVQTILSVHEAIEALKNG